MKNFIYTFNNDETLFIDIKPLVFGRQIIYYKNNVNCCEEFRLLVKMIEEETK